MAVRTWPKVFSFFAKGQIGGDRSPGGPGCGLWVPESHRGGGSCFPGQSASTKSQVTRPGEGATTLGQARLFCFWFCFCFNSQNSSRREMAWGTGFQPNYIPIKSPTGHTCDLSALQGIGERAAPLPWSRPLVLLPQGQAPGSPWGGGGRVSLVEAPTQKHTGASPPPASTQVGPPSWGSAGRSQPPILLQDTQ